jgi:hypothetical protein
MVKYGSSTPFDVRHSRSSSAPGLPAGSSRGREPPVGEQMVQLRPESPRLTLASFAIRVDVMIDGGELP